jgi:hypothetical protein
MYADDVQLYNSGERTDIARTIGKLNADLSSIWDWSLQNGLCLNPEKSKALIISLQPMSSINIPPIKLNGSVVPYCDKVKNLGLLINQKLTWKDQVSVSQIFRLQFLVLKRIIQ